MWEDLKNLKKRQKILLALMFSFLAVSGIFFLVFIIAVMHTRDISSMIFAIIAIVFLGCGLSVNFVNAILN